MEQWIFAHFRYLLLNTRRVSNGRSYGTLGTRIHSYSSIRGRKYTVRENTFTFHIEEFILPFNYIFCDRYDLSFFIVTLMEWMNQSSSQRSFAIAFYIKTNGNLSWVLQRPVGFGSEPKCWFNTNKKVQNPLPEADHPLRLMLED